MNRLAILGSLNKGSRLCVEDPTKYVSPSITDGNRLGLLIVTSAAEAGILKIPFSGTTVSRALPYTEAAKDAHYTICLSASLKAFSNLLKLSAAPWAISFWDSPVISSNIAGE